MEKINVEKILNSEIVTTLKKGNDVEKQTFSNLAKWLEDERLEAYRPYIAHLVESGNRTGLLDAFWRVMPFGTGGRRGPVGAGPNRINPYTISLSVQGHCDYLKNVVGMDGEMSVVVAFDVRKFCDLRGVYEGVDGLLDGLSSRDLAKECARTYAANGVVAYVVGPLEDEPGIEACTDKYISTPELSFLIRELKAAGGLNISASHNHPDDNGGKFYNFHGGQEIPPDDEALLNVVENVKDIKTISYLEAREKNLIRFVPEELHAKYLDLNKEMCPTQSRTAKVAFTPLCGTGDTTVVQALTALGFEVLTVPDQSIYDGSFSSVPFRIPNPEVPQSMGKLNDLAAKSGCDIAFATDPDADRLGVTVPDENGDFVFLNGNEIGVVLVEALLASKRKAGTLTESSIFVNTAVTSSLQREIAKRYGCQVVGDLMVGFKYMGDVLKHLEEKGQFPPNGKVEGEDYVRGTLKDFVLADEESHGYLLTPKIRDKDACGPAVFLAGLASEIKDEGGSIIGMLRNIYRLYGYFRNELRFLVMEGITGLNRIKQIQDRLRANPPSEIAGMKVVKSIDYHKVGGPLKSSTDEASRNVLSYELETETGPNMRITVRPSGTEPKTKIYIEVPSGTGLEGTLEAADADALASVTDQALDEVVAKTNARSTRVGNEFIKYCLGPEILGDVYSSVPEESLLVSDLVPVDQKITLILDIFPTLMSKLESGKSSDEISSWLDRSLKPFGEDPRGLIETASKAWLKRYEREHSPDSTHLKAAAKMLQLSETE